MSARPLVIIGGSGQLGTALRGAFVGRDVHAPSHDELSIERADAVAAAIDELEPAAVINCAAFHKVDVCEREAESAFAINALAVDRVAAICAARGATFLSVSTDYVFDGTLDRAYREDDPANPRTVYGTSKFAGELLIRRHGGRHIIVRTSGVFGTTGTSNKGYTLIEKVLQQAERGEATRMVADMVFSPSYAPHVARAIRDLVEAEAYGTHHVTNRGACSWYDFVKTAFSKAGLSDARLEPVTYASMGNPTPRPMFSPLENTTFAIAGIDPMPAWERALDEFLAARKARFAAART